MWVSLYNISYGITLILLKLDTPSQVALPILKIKLHILFQLMVMYLYHSMGIYGDMFLSIAHSLVISLPRMKMVQGLYYNSYAHCTTQIWGPGVTHQGCLFPLDTFNKLHLSDFLGSWVHTIPAHFN